MTEFRIADTFTDSLSGLTAQEQKAVKTTAFDLQLNPASPGLKFHRIDRSKDPNFWSLRVNADIRCRSASNPDPDRRVTAPSLPALRCAARLQPRRCVTTT